MLSDRVRSWLKDKVQDEIESALEEVIDNYDFSSIDFVSKIEYAAERHIEDEVDSIIDEVLDEIF